MKRQAKVVPFRRPKSFTSAEALIDEVRAGLLAMNVPRRIIADKCNVSISTITNLAMGKTRWPRPTTLFPIIDALGMQLTLTQKDKR